MIIVNSQEQFSSLTPEPGMLVNYQDKLYLYNQGWQVISGTVEEDDQAQTAVLSVNLYDLNKNIISQLEDIKDFSEAIALLNSYNQNFQNDFYMLFGYDLKYFTVFTSYVEDLDNKTFGENVISCLLNITPHIKSVDYNQDKDAIEIWVEHKDELFVLYLFPYDNGVVPIGG